MISIIAEQGRYNVAHVCEVLFIPLWRLTRHLFIHMTLSTTLSYTGDTDLDMYRLVIMDIDIFITNFSYLTILPANDIFAVA